MKIYFTASLAGKKEYAENYRKIVETLEFLGFEVEADHILGIDFPQILKQSYEEKISFYKRAVNKIKKTDLVVAEVSFPSINVGHEVTLALSYNKPVVALHLPGKEPHLLEGFLSDKLRIVQYTLENLKKNLEEALDVAKDQMDVRFNFFISPEIGAYLDWVARNKKIPRAVYLRKLIEEDMFKSEYYLQKTKRKKEEKGRTKKSK